MKTFFLSVGSNIYLDGDNWNVHSSQRKSSGDLIFNLKKTEIEEYLTINSEELLRAFEQGRMQGVALEVNKAPVNKGKVQDPSYSKDQKKIINYRKSYLLEVLDKDGNLIRSEKQRKKILVKIHTNFSKALQLLGQENTQYEKCITDRTVRNWYKNWVAAGRQDHGLLPSFGEKQQRESRIDPETLKKVASVISQLVLRRERWTIVDVAAEIEEVSYATILRYWHKYKNQYETDLAQLGYFRAKSKTPDNSSRPLPDSILVECESDHHELDVLVVNIKNNVILGKAIITIIIDVKSGIIFGRYISFRKNQNAVLKAIRHAILPKTDKRWVFGKPLNLHCDNSDGYNVITLGPALLEIEIQPTNMRKKHGNDKARVERAGGAINQFVCHKLKGTTFENYLNAEDYKSEKFAFIEFNELQNLVDEYILDIHNNRRNKITRKSRNSIWHSDPMSKYIALPTSIQAAHILTMQMAIRSINRDGIYINNMLYDDNNLTDLKRRHCVTSEVQVRYDEDDLSNIWVKHESDMEWVNVMARDDIYHDPNYSLVLHNALRKEAEKQGISTEELIKNRKKINHQIQGLNKLSGKRANARASGISSENPTGKKSPEFSPIDLNASVFEKSR